MSDHHLDLNDFRRLAAGALSQEETTRASLHLLECFPCRRALEEIASEAAELLKVLLGDLLLEAGEQPAQATVRDCSASASFSGALESKTAIRENCSLRDAETVSTTELQKELTQLPATARRERILGDRRYHCPELAKSLIADSWKLKREDPIASEELALTALEILERVDGAFEERPALVDLQARAWAYIGNARRIRSSWAEALAAFETAEELLALGSREPVRRAEVLYLKGVLLREQRRFDDAARLLDQAIAIYSWAGNWQGTCQVLISKARVFEMKEEYDAAIPLLVEASDLIDEASDPFLLLCVWHNLAKCLVGAGEPLEARELLPAVKRLSGELGHRHDALRLRWLEGLIARDLDEAEEAETIFREVREEFISDGIAIDAALVSLDLAAVLLSQGRTRETRRLAEEMLPIFNSLEIRRETFASLILFQRAALREEATVQMVHDIAACLRRAGSTPALRYEKPS